MVKLKDLIDSGFVPAVKKGRSVRNFSKLKKVDYLVISRKGRLSLPKSFRVNENLENYEFFVPLQKKKQDKRNELYLFLMTSQEVEDQNPEGKKQINFYPPKAKKEDRATAYLELRTQMIALGYIINLEKGPSFKVHKFRVDGNILILDMDRSSIKEVHKDESIE